MKVPEQVRPITGQQAVKEIDGDEGPERRQQEAFGSGVQPIAGNTDPAAGMPLVVS